MADKKVFKNLLVYLLNSTQECIHRILYLEQILQLVL